MATMDVEVFECQRHRVMSGWSSDNLLPHDRNAFRIRGAKKSWKSLAELSDAMLAPGWAWEQMQDEFGCIVEWAISPVWGQDDVDTGGWTYATDFSANFVSSNPKWSINRQVRWRTLMRTQNFSGTQALSACVHALAANGGSSTGSSCSTADDATPLVAPAEQAQPAQPPVQPICPNVDLEGAAHIERQLVEAVALASLYGEWSMRTLVQLKSQLVDQVAATPVAANGGTLEASLSSFVGKQRSVATRMSEAFSRRSQDEEVVAARLQDVEEKTPSVELEALAVVVIRRFRPDLACDGRCEAQTCNFRPVSCPNPGCSVRCCAKDLAKHDETCPHKLLPCAKCGEEVQRGKMSVHLAMACPEREASCCFSALGCQAQLVHRELNDHLEECTQAHLMLLMREFLEQQDTVKEMRGRLADTEAQAVQAKADRDRILQKSTALETRSAGLETQVASMEKKAAHDLKKAMAPVEALKKSLAAATEDTKKRIDASSKQAKKQVDIMEKSHTAEVQVLRSEIAALETTVGEVGALRAELTLLQKGPVPDVAPKSQGHESETKVQN